ncbi:hypothetical protein CS344_20060 [Bordetella bronchiseptica]|uniref:hypothetical protein n=1 Tax=Bordetella bronchiseptica TaxID=518 RepID=UPI000FD70E6E|nr:hypothetical protein [Bordetella bronchiseptica]AZW14210.1 hypothetical protein CS344_20060 [Bordetella bronchiseptica]QBS70745.1 hypothetical protein B2C13_19745 [Bordetella bronchiseptica]
MKEITEFLLSVYPGREWQLPQGGGLADVDWLDGPAPNDLEQQYADYVPAVAPVSVSRFQALAALLQAGLLEAVTAWANDPGTDPLHKLAFETATEFSRTSPTLAAGAAALGWSEQQLDALFDAAMQIQA